MLARPWRTGILALALLLPTVAQADPKDDARRHFAAGLEAAKNGDYEIALQRFLAAQEAYPHPATLYNIAQAYMDMGDLKNAKIYYQLYRDAAPEKAPEIDPILAAIEARAGSGSAPTTGPTEPTGPAAGGTGGASVVVTGPTEEEMDRITTLATDFQSLLGEVEQRQADGGEGANEEEIARLDGMAAELEALVAVVNERKEADMAAIAAARSGEGTGEVPEVPEVPEGEIPEAPDGAGFLEGAYDKIVVTASRVGQDPLDSPSTLTVLTAEDVRMMGAQNVDDVLRRVVGVNVMYNAAGHSDVGIRGFQRKVNNKVLILIDGRSTYSDFAAITFIKGFPISMEEIERIEIIRGPGSAVYGANAVTGVVNIITKTPGETPENLASIDMGSPGLARGTVYTNGASKDGQTAYRLAFGYQQHGRWAKEVDNTTKDGELKEGLSIDAFTPDQDIGNQLLRGNGRIDQRFGSKGFASLSGGLSTGMIELYNIGALPNYGVDITSTYLRGDVAWGNLHVRSFWNADSGLAGPWIEQQGQARTLDGYLDADVFDLEIEGPIEFTTGAADHTLNLGVGYRFKRIEFGNYFAGVPYTENHFNGFINEQVAIGKFGAVASLRVDRHPLLDLQETVSPRLALLYRLFEKTSVRATFGTAFRQPTALESYMDFDLNNPAADGVFIRDLGNLNLSPERINTIEVGIHDESTFFHTADVVVYRNVVSQFIDLAPINKEINAFTDDGNGVEFGQTGWINLEDIYTGMGLEAELELYPTDGLDVHGNVALQSVVKNAGTPQSTPDNSVSAVQLNAGTMYRAPFRMDFTYDLHYVGPQTWSLRGFDSQGGIAFEDADLPARTLMSVRVAGRPFADERLELAANAWNFLELAEGAGFREHPEGQPVAGRLFGTVTYRF